MNRQMRHAQIRVSGYRTPGAAVMAAFLVTFFYAWLCASVANVPASSSSDVFATPAVQIQAAPAVREHVPGHAAGMTGYGAGAVRNPVALNSANGNSGRTETEIFSGPAQCNMLTKTCGGAH